MMTSNQADVLIIGGSYAGLSAAMALGRSMRSVIVLDSGEPCNRQTPESHNFLTHDGDSPQEIARSAKEQVLRYDTVQFREGCALRGEQQADGFLIETAAGEQFLAKKLLIAAGVKDELPPLEGFAECWGISVLHCPYCHGYEVKNAPLGVLGNGNHGYELAKLIRHWTDDLVLFTDGPSELVSQQVHELERHRVRIVETPLTAIVHEEGYVRNLALKDGSHHELTALFTKVPFKQHCDIPRQLGCEFTEAGFIRIDSVLQSTVHGVYAAGDCTTLHRAVSAAVAAGGKAGTCMNKELLDEEWGAETV